MSELPHPHQPDDPFPYITICGPMRGFDAMIEEAKRLTELGWIVLMPFVNKAEGHQVIGERLDAMHQQKIRLSRAILVVTIDGYVGWSTREEILSASSQNKSIYWSNHTTEEAAEQQSSASVDRSEVREFSAMADARHILASMERRRRTAALTDSTGIPLSDVTF